MQEALQTHGVLLQRWALQTKWTLLWFVPSLHPMRGDASRRNCALRQNHKGSFFLIKGTFPLQLKMINRLTSCCTFYSVCFRLYFQGSSVQTKWVFFLKTAFFCTCCSRYMFRMCITCSQSLRFVVPCFDDWFIVDTAYLNCLHFGLTY